jgi:hypothetical protein
VKGHVHFLDSKDLRCAICGMDARRCQHEQGRVAIAMSQPVPFRPVGNRVFLYGHEVRP